MNRTEPVVATEDAYFLAEGPTWDAASQRLLWVDIMAGAVHVGRLADDGTIEHEKRIDLPDTAGAVAVSAEGDLVVAGTDRLYRVGRDAITPGPQLVEGDDRRFNDGKPDPAGRFVVGTKGPSDREQLLRVELDGRVTVLDDDLSLSNGLAWSADGRLMYSIDSPTHRVFVRDYEPLTGDTGPRRVFATVDQGYPDGATIDAEDHLWVAVWGGSCVLRFAPSGEIVDRIDLPVPHVSCPAFAGDDLGTLVITTATEGMTDAALAQHPLAGRLFTVRPGVSGIPPLLWSGRLG